MQQVREHLYRQGETLASHGERLSSLETWRANMQARHAAVPQWLFGVLSVIGMIIGMVLTLYMAGVIP